MRLLERRDGGLDGEMVPSTDAVTEASTDAPLPSTAAQ